MSSTNLTPEVVTCFCDHPVAIRTSNTTKNPGRPFEKCATGGCKYWEWRDNVGYVGRGGMAHNYGREFARCRHPDNARRCTYFKFTDGQDSQEVFNEYMDARLY
ncbi:hypothetical protein B0H11DRAFT_2187731 [Mycena galericulata]|nr:hypothetical protein B0H11DRAFT_2187731 [Mycena galericulata]